MSDPALPPPLPPEPVFVVGYPRSGTTLLQAMLAAQPGVVSFPETHFFGPVSRHLRLSAEGAVLPECLGAVLEKGGLKTGLPVTPPEAEALAALAQAGRLTEKGLFEWFVHRFLRAAGHPDAPRTPFRWLEKTPGHVFRMARIVTLYPDARFVHIVRHPLPAVLSRKRHFPGDHDKPYSRLADRWREAVEAAAAFEASRPERVRTVRYEQLAADPRGVVETLADWLGLALDPAWMEKRRELCPTIAHDWETWKDSVAGPLRNTNAASVKAGPLRERLRIQYRLRKPMAAWGYRPFSPFLQACYNAGRRLIG
ncbi:MAG: sulfotransferase [Acidobacteria bacterium]|nr:sulfotransferase [Acidobacteriota bacterium]